MMERADRIIDLGPAAGIHGGELLAIGTPAEIKASGKSLTGLFLAKGITHPTRGEYRPVKSNVLTETRPIGALLRKKTPSGPAPFHRDWLELKGARFRNLKGFN